MAASYRIGFKNSPETRAKMSAAHLGKKRGPHTPEAKAKMRAACAGRIPSVKCLAKAASPEARAKLSATMIGNKHNLGKKLSQETRAKISAALTGLVRSEESRAKQGARQRGVKRSPPSEQTRAKISATLIGRPGRRGWIPSEEVRAKMRVAAKKRGISQETRTKIANARRGKKLGPHSAETRAKISLANRGQKRRPLTQEHRARISATGKKRAASRSSEMLEKIAAARRKPCDAETRAKIGTANKGKVRSAEFRARISAAHKGERSWRWRGGTSKPFSRGIDWGIIKRQRRELAGHRCEICGVASKSRWDLAVHHIIPYRILPATKLEHCIAVCRSCHSKAEIGSIHIDDVWTYAGINPRLLSVPMQWLSLLTTRIQSRASA